MKKKKNAEKCRTKSSANILYPLIFSLFVSSCGHYDGKLSYFDLLDDNKKTLANKRAAEKFWTSVRPVSTLSDSHYRLGLHYQQLGEYGRAIGEFTKALRIDRNYCKAYNGIAMSYDIQKRCEPARASYEQALKCAPNEAYIYNNYACSSLLCGDYGKGMNLLHKAESLAENNNRIKNNLRIAQTIAIHENLSEYFRTGELPLLSTSDSGAPGIEKTLPDPVCKIPVTTRDAISTEIDKGDKPTDNQPEFQLVPIAEVAAVTSNRKTESAPYDVVYSNNLYAGKSANSVGGAILSAPGLITVAIEVSNGNGTTGMAKRSAAFLRGQGYTVRSITNAKHFRFEESVIYYKDEYLQAAKDLAAVIPGTQNLEKVEAMEKPSIGVRVILGRDLANMRFPEGYAGLADNRQYQHVQDAVITASNHPVHY